MDKRKAGQVPGRRPPPSERGADEEGSPRQAPQAEPPGTVDLPPPWHQRRKRD